MCDFLSNKCTASHIIVEIRLYRSLLDWILIDSGRGPACSAVCSKGRFRIDRLTACTLHPSIVQRLLKLNTKYVEKFVVGLQSQRMFINFLRRRYNKLHYTGFGLPDRLSICLFRTRS